MSRVQVTVTWITPEVQDIVPVALERGATVGDAIRASRLVSTYALDLEKLGVAVAGARRRLHDAVHDGERIDLLRSLTVDPKEARRARAHLKPLRHLASRAKRRSSAGSD
jgi:putative ubiquitin-RnfH superfamily antitoxin RatB of RatAB toxin-antitoxin module